MQQSEPGPAAAPLVCVRCRRAPRGPDDRATWVVIDDNSLCPGCLTLDEVGRLRADKDRRSST
jgi:hypothetical protein